MDQRVWVSVVPLVKQLFPELTEPAVPHTTLTLFFLSVSLSLFLTESPIYLNSYLLFESTHYLQVATHFSDAFQSETRCLASKMLDLIISIVSIRRWKVVMYQYRARPNVSLLQFGLLSPIICMAYVKTKQLQRKYKLLHFERCNSVNSLSLRKKCINK